MLTLIHVVNSRQRSKCTSLGFLEPYSHADEMVSSGSGPKWARKLLRNTDARLRADQLDTACGITAWDGVAGYLTHLLQKIATADITAQMPYNYTVKAVDVRAEGGARVRNVEFSAHRREHVPRGLTTTSEDRPSLPGLSMEEPAYLIFSCANDGSVAAIAYPHSSTNGQLTDGSHYFLADFARSDQVLTWTGRRKVRRAVSTFLMLHQYSAFGRKPRWTDWKIRARLDRARNRYESVYASPKERRLELLRTDLLLGTAACASLLAVVATEASKLFPKLSSETSITWELVSPTIVPTVVLVSLLLILKVVLKRP